MGVARAVRHPARTDLPVADCQLTRNVLRRQDSAVLEGISNRQLTEHTPVSRQHFDFLRKEVRWLRSAVQEHCCLGCTVARNVTSRACLILYLKVVIVARSRLLAGDG